MLGKLRARFAGDAGRVCHHADGLPPPPLPEASLDYVAAFDVFVHYEPRLIYWYLRQIARLLKPGGVGIIHYSNILSPPTRYRGRLPSATRLRHSVHTPHRDDAAGGGD